jgi:hypothetical protein
MTNTTIHSEVGKHPDMLIQLTSGLFLLTSARPEHFLSARQYTLILLTSMKICEQPWLRYPILHKYGYVYTVYARGLCIGYISW